MSDTDLQELQDRLVAEFTELCGNPDDDTVASAVDETLQRLDVLAAAAPSEDLLHLR